ncbi:hypothetical protein [Escherichia phage P896]|nr:hypothetical protein [Escherichia phage P896]
MFVVHDISDGRCSTHDYGNVTQFLRAKPLYNQARYEKIFMECVEQGFIYISEYFVTTSRGRRWINTYQKTLNELQDEVAYNRIFMTRRDIK